jgi:hypothetical protein
MDMSKGLIAFIIVACIAIMSMVVMFLKQSADEGRKKQNKIMEQFKTVDKDLHKSNERLYSLNKMDFDSSVKANK